MVELEQKMKTAEIRMTRVECLEERHLEDPGVQHVVS
jgi:hypothetical protein